MIEQLTQTLIEQLEKFSNLIPLPWFAFLGSIIEEIIAPIPSPLIMTLSGSLAASKNYLWISLGFIALIAAIGKTFASYLMYMLADKGEDFVVGKFGKFLGVSHKEIEGIGRHLNKGWRDDVVLILLRAIPIIPTAPVSIICGIVKLNVRTYITSTFIGVLIRNIFYLGVGYAGVNAVETIITQVEDFKIVGYIIILLILAGIFGYVFYQKHKDALLNKLFPTQDPKPSSPKRSR